MESKREIRDAVRLTREDGALERAMGQALLAHAKDPEDVALLLESSAALRRVLEDTSLFPGACGAVTHEGRWCPRVHFANVRPWDEPQYCRDYCNQDVARWEEQALARAPTRAWNLEGKYVPLEELGAGLRHAVQHGNIDAVYRYWHALLRAEERRGESAINANNALEGAISQLSPTGRERWTLPQLADLLARTVGAASAWSYAIPLLLRDTSPDEPLGSPQGWATALPLSDQQLDGAVEHFVLLRHQGEAEDQSHHEIPMLVSIAKAFPGRRLTGDGRRAVMNWVRELAEPDSWLLEAIGNESAEKLLAAAHALLGDAAFEEAIANWPLDLLCHFAATRVGLDCAPPAPPAPVPAVLRTAVRI